MPSSETSNVELKVNSKEAVAFDLMKYIVIYEKPNEQQLKDRQYWLTLYSQCLKATNG